MVYLLFSALPLAWCHACEQVVLMPHSAGSCVQSVQTETSVPHAQDEAGLVDRDSNKLEH